MAFKNTINNTELYNSIHSRMRKEHKKLGKRWGIYSSSELIRRYKKAGGTFKTKRNIKKSPLSSRKCLIYRSMLIHFTILLSHNKYQLVSKLLTVFFRKI